MTSLGLALGVGSARPAPPSIAWDRDELAGVRQGYCALVLLCALLQLVFFWRAEDNLVSVLIATASSLLGIVHSLDGRRFRALPVSALMMLLYTTTSTAGALLVKTVDWDPLADRLTVPVETFTVLFAGQVMLILADRLYFKARLLQVLRQQITRRFLMPLGVMRWPSDGELWVLGGIGIVSVLLTGTDYETSASFGMAGAGAKVLRVFGFLKYAPFLIPFRDALGGVPRRVKFPVVPLALYFCALVGISFATNSRSTFADAVPTIGVCVLAAQAVGRIDYRRFPPQKLILYGAVAVGAALLLSRVALAMVVARDFRYNSDALTVVSTTIEAFFNTEWLNAAKAKMDTSISLGNYSEEYVNSRFFARFLLTKFHDNILYYFSLMGPDQVASYEGFMVERLVGTLPGPLIQLLGLGVEKLDLVVSNGDYVVYIVDGWGLGGFKTGSMIGEVWGVFGWGFPLVMLASALLLYVVYDSLTMPSAEGRIVMSPLILLLMWNLCGTTAAFGLGAETVVAILSGVVRGMPQNVLAYAFAVWAVRQAIRLVARPA